MQFAATPDCDSWICQPASQFDRTRSFCGLSGAIPFQQGQWQLGPESRRAAPFGHQSTGGVRMYRRILIGCLAVIGGLMHLTADAGAQPKPEGKAKPNQGREIYVIMKARLYKVDEAFHNKLAKAKWRSRTDLEELETKPPADGSLFALLAKQKPFLAGKEINIDPGKQGVLLTAIKPINCLPTPDQLRQGNVGIGQKVGQNVGQKTGHPLPDHLFATNPLPL
jgi:hypothetical protein